MRGLPSWPWLWRHSGLPAAAGVLDALGVLHHSQKRQHSSSATSSTHHAVTDVIHETQILSDSSLNSCQVGACVKSMHRHACYVVSLMVATFRFGALQKGGAGELTVTLVLASGPGRYKSTSHKSYVPASHFGWLKSTMVQPWKFPLTVYSISSSKAGKDRKP